MDLKTDGVTIYAPAKEKVKIPGVDVALNPGDTVEFGGQKGGVMDVGGHTHAHIAYHFADEEAVFVGDALFSLGCGRMFEGTPTQFWTSLKGLRELPDETTVYWYVHVMMISVVLVAVVVVVVVVVTATLIVLLVFDCIHRPPTIRTLS